MMRLHKTDGSKPVNLLAIDTDDLKTHLLLRLNVGNSSGIMCNEFRILVDEIVATINCQQKNHNLVTGAFVRKIQSLEAQLANARQGNRNLSLLLGEAQKRASKVCAVKDNLK